MDKKEILMQPNNLIKSKYNFTSVENKLFYKLLFNAQKQNSKSPLYETYISIEELKKFMKNNNDIVYSGTNYILNLFKQSIMEFEYIDENGQKLIFSSGLVTSSSFNSETQMYKVEIHEVLYRHITDFVNMQKEGLGYTALNLALLFNFRGAYSQRLYTLLRLWSRQHKEVEVKYSVNRLRDLLKISDDIYPAYKNFKQKVINKSINEINEIGNMHIEIKEEKKIGRKVDEIIFKVIDFEPRKYFELNNQDIFENKEFKENQKHIDLENVKVIKFYIPNKKLFTAKTLHMFEQDFKNYDFSLKDFKKVLQDSILITLEKDDEEKIKLKSYNYFKVTLSNKIKNLEGAKQNEFTPKANTRFHNITQTYNKYNPDELEYMLNENQKEKFGENHHLVNLYNSVINDNKWNELSDISKRNLIKYANENELFIPGEWQMSLDK